MIIILLAIIAATLLFGAHIALIGLGIMIGGWLLYFFREQLMAILAAVIVVGTLATGLWIAYHPELKDDSVHSYATTDLKR